MKKLYSAVILMLTSVAVWAQAPVGTTLLSRAADNAAMSINGDATPAISVVSHNAKAKSIVKTGESLPTKDDIIYDQPEGTLYKNMYHAANVYVAYGQTSTNRYYDGYVGDVVISNDGKKVYVKDPFLKFAPGTWIVGDMNENGIVRFRFPQAIYYQSSPEEILGYAYKMIVSNGEIGPDKLTQDVKFKWDGTKLSQVNEEDFIGMTNSNGEWLGYGALQNEYSVQTDELVMPTDASKAQTYKMMYGDRSGSVSTTSAKVCVEGNTLYIGGFYQPDFWIKGSILNDKVTFPSFQYMGIKGSSHAYMLALDPTTMQPLSVMDFDYDAESGTLTSDKAIEINIGKNALNALELFITPVLGKVDYVTEAPAAPEVTNVMPWGSDPNEPEIAAIVYKLSDVSVNGNQLNQKNIYYNLYIEDKLYTFTKDKYSFIKNDMTDIPFAFADSYTNWNGEKGWDFKTANGEQYIYLYTPFTTFGLQAIYVDGDKRYPSEISTYKIKTDGIDNAITDNMAEKSITYYDLSGRKVAQPTNGIYLKNITYSNGSTKTVKVMK